MNLIFAAYTFECQFDISFQDFVNLGSGLAVGLSGLSGMMVDLFKNIRENESPI